MWTGSATLVTAALCTFQTAYAGYTIKDDYSGDKFFGMFDFFTDSDPTKGYVDYIAQSAAQSAGLINTNNNQIYMGVDSKNVASGRGRKSVRLTSKATYNHALIILDLEHMPGSICGTWPAFWTVGPNWPNSGEIDIIEGVNTQSHNAMTLHTGPGCSIPKISPKRAQAFSGSVRTTNCDVAAPGQDRNVGCSIATSDTSTYGSGLNAISGGVYATEWTSNAISMWFFPRNAIPSNLASSPDPSSWGTPLASFASTSCNIDSSIKNQQIVFDTTFCGEWAGSVWSSDPTCSAKAATCQDYVQNNPAAFADAYWSINSLKVFSSDGSSGSNPPRPVPGASSTAIATGRPVSTPSGPMPPFIPAPSGTRPAGSTSSPGTKSVPTPFVSGPASGSKPVVPVSTASNPVRSSPAPPSATSFTPSIPRTTLATSTQAQAQAQSSGNRWGNGNGNNWGGSNRNTRYWGGGRPRAMYEGHAYAERDSTSSPTSSAGNGPEGTDTPSLPMNIMDLAQTPTDLDLDLDLDVSLVRRHMAEHAHGHGHVHGGGR